MKLINPDVKQLVNENPFKQIEEIGRVCYKSEDKITKDSWKPFVTTLINNKHYAMLEHGIFHFSMWDSGVVDYYYAYPGVVISELDDWDFVITASYSAIIQHCKTDIIFAEMYKLISKTYDFSPLDESELCKDEFCEAIKLENESNIIQYIKSSESNELFESFSENEIPLHQFRSIKFICSRGISHELVRHRCSAAQESTRYCNYSKDKFGNDISFILPSVFDSWDMGTQQQFVDGLLSCEELYFNLVNSGIAPQHARDILPNALKTEVILTMPLSQWKHFLDIRLRGTTGAPHPDMKILAEKVQEIIY